MAMRILLSFVIGFAAIGCQPANLTGIQSLPSVLNPEGFWVIKDINRDTTRAGNFLVTCASSRGGESSNSVTQAQIEANQVCLPVAAGVQSTGSSAQTKATSSAGQFSVMLKQNSYLKKSALMNVTRDIDKLKLGVDYCVISEDLLSDKVCVKGSEYQISNITLSGCNFTSGFIYADHFSVSPAAPACP